MLSVAAVLAVVLASIGILTARDEPPLVRTPPRDFVLDTTAGIERIGAYETEDSDFTNTSAFQGDVEVTDTRAFRGMRSVVASVRSPDGFGYARVEEAVAWNEGDDVWYGAAVYLERGFKDAQADGSVDIMRWDNWPEHPDTPDHGGLAVLSDGTLALIREQLDGEPWEVVLGAYSIPEGRWVWLEVRQRFSPADGTAINELWMDGRKLGENREANSFGRTITRHRVGIISTPDPQPDELRLYLDQPVISERGPIMVVQ